MVSLSRIEKVTLLIEAKFHIVMELSTVSIYYLQLDYAIL
jgi:hypothetical protein